MQDSFCSNTVIILEFCSFCFHTLLLLCTCPSCIIAAVHADTLTSASYSQCLFLILFITFSEKARQTTAKIFQKLPSDAFLFSYIIKIRKNGLGMFIYLQKNIFQQNNMPFVTQNTTWCSFVILYVHFIMSEQIFEAPKNRLCVCRYVSCKKLW